MLSKDLQAQNLDSLKKIFKASDIFTDEDSLSTYGRDWTKHYKADPLAIVFPRTTEEVQGLVKWARKTKSPLVPSGGRTGLSAGAYATNKEVIVSFEKMNRILDFNETDQVITAEAGVITETLQKYAVEKGYLFPVDFASRGSSQIGGNVATNAGGIKVIRYGLIRNWVTGLKVVTGQGEVLNLNNSLVKNATGYDLRQLFIGSEGTLGFITEVSVQVTTPPKETFVMVLGATSLDAIMKIYTEFRKSLPILAYEMFTDKALKYVTDLGRVKAPFETPAVYYVLIEVEKTDDSVEEKALGLFENLMEKELCVDGTLSQNPKQAMEFWSLREDITEATSHKSPYKNDVSVRVSKVPQFLNDVTDTIAKEHPDFEVVWFGHIGDGNLHINVLKPEELTSEDFIKRCHEVDKILFEKIERLGGSVSAEHGVGLVKKPYLHHSRSSEEIRLMKEIKKIFDPDQILNPGKIFD